MEKKFQWSKTVGGEMYVIRTDDKEEFDKLVAEYKGASSTTVQAVSHEAPSDDTKMCPIHPDKKMYKKTGQYGEYWSHGNKEVGYCNGKPKYEKTY